MNSSPWTTNRYSAPMASHSLSISNVRVVRCFFSIDRVVTCSRPGIFVGDCEQRLVPHGAIIGIVRHALYRSVPPRGCYVASFKPRQSDGFAISDKCTPAQL